MRLPETRFQVRASRRECSAPRRCTFARSPGVFFSGRLSGGRINSERAIQGCTSFWFADTHSLSWSICLYSGTGL